MTLRDYLFARRKIIEANITAEELSGNGYKQNCEKMALAEIAALEKFINNREYNYQRCPSCKEEAAELQWVCEYCGERWGV